MTPTTCAVHGKGSPESGRTAASVRTRAGTSASIAQPAPSRAARCLVWPVADLAPLEQLHAACRLWCRGPSGDGCLFTPNSRGGQAVAEVARVGRVRVRRPCRPAGRPASSLIAVRHARRGRSRIPSDDARKLLCRPMPRPCASCNRPSQPPRRDQRMKVRVAVPADPAVRGGDAAPCPRNTSRWRAVIDRRAVRPGTAICRDGGHGQTPATCSPDRASRTHLLLPGRTSSPW
jgi:hypothetical protein